jgi:hypothetical protein
MVVPLLLCAVAVPAAADARDASVEPTATAKGGNFHVAFRVIEQGGDPVAVKRLRFRRLPVDCNEGSFFLRGRIPGRFRVNDRDRFHAIATDPNGGEVKVNGEFKDNDRKVVGRVKASGDFGTNANNCGGAKRYVAT